MKIHHLKLFSSVAMLCLAASMAWLGYAILALVRDLPDALENIAITSEQLEPVVDQTESIVELIPDILAEVERVREQIPSILEEVKATREATAPLLAEWQVTRTETIPSVLTEWQLTRTETIPSVLEESVALRGEVPAILRESRGYRALVPDVLAELQNIHTTLPVTLTRLEDMVDQAQTIANSAGENAITGFFTGIVKAPFNLLSGVGEKLSHEDIKLSDKEYKLMERNGAAMLSQSPVGDQKILYNHDKSLKIILQLEREFNKGEKFCRVLSIDLTRDDKVSSYEQVAACLSADGKWKLQ